MLSTTIVVGVVGPGVLRTVVLLLLVVVVVGVVGPRVGAAFGKEVGGKVVMKRGLVVVGAFVFSETGVKVVVEELGGGVGATMGAGDGRGMAVTIC